MNIVSNPSEDEQIQLIQLENIQIDETNQGKEILFKEVKQLLIKSTIHLSLHQENITLFFQKKQESYIELEQGLDLFSKLEIAIIDMIYLLIKGVKPKIIENESITYLEINQLHQDEINSNSIIQKLIQFIQKINWNVEYSQQVTDQFQYWQSNSIEIKKSIQIQQLGNEIQIDPSIILMNQMFSLLRTTFLFLSFEGKYNLETAKIILGEYSNLIQFMGFKVGALTCLINLLKYNVKLQNEFNLNQNNWVLLQILTSQINKNDYYQNILNFLLILIGQTQKHQDEERIRQLKNIIINSFIKSQYYIPIINENNLIYLLIENKQIELSQLYYQNSKANYKFLPNIVKCKQYIDLQFQLINLCCQGRNYSNIQYFNERIQFNILIQYILKDNVVDKLKLNFIQLIITFYLNKYKLYNRNQFNEKKNIFILNNKKQFNNQKQIELPFQIIEISNNLLQKIIIIQQTIDFTIDSQQALENLINLYIIFGKYYKQENQEFVKLQDILNFLIKIFDLLTISMAQDQPSLDLSKACEQFEVQKDIFNSMVLQFIKLFSYLISKFESSVILQSVTQQQDSNDFILNFTTPNYYTIIKNRILLLFNHNQIKSSVKVKILSLLINIHCPKYSIIKSLQQSFFIENDEQEIYQNIRNIKRELIYFEQNFKIEEILLNNLNNLISDFIKQAQNNNTLLLYQLFMKIENIDLIVFNMLQFLQQYLNNIEVVNNLKQLFEIYFNLLTLFILDNRYNAKRILQRMIKILQYFEFQDFGQFKMLKELFNFKQFFENFIDFQEFDKLIQLNDNEQINEFLQKLFKQESLKIKINNLDNDQNELQLENLNNSKVQQLIELDYKIKNKFLKLQINTQIITKDQLIEEKFIMFQNLYKQNFFTTQDNKNFNLQIQNINKSIGSFYESLQFCNSIENLSELSKSLKFLEQWIDLHNYVYCSNFQVAKLNYNQGQLGKFDTEKNKILQIKRLKEFQDLIISGGFFNELIKFCIFYDEVVNSSFQIIILKQKKLEKIFKRFLLIAIKLVRGIENVNQNAQFHLVEEMKKKNNWSLLKILYNNIDQLNNNNQFLNISNQFNRIQLANNFNCNNILENSSEGNYELIYLYFKFIQYFSEDHYRPFQNIVRFQIGNENNYDIISKLSKILLEYFSKETKLIITFNEYQNVIACLECINELIQGPCSENQEKICTPTFLRLCVKLLKEDDSQNAFIKKYIQFSDMNNNQQERDRQLTQTEMKLINQQKNLTNLQNEFINYYNNHKNYQKLIIQQMQQCNPKNFKIYMISEIKYKCTQLIESLLDDSSDSNIFLNHIIQVFNEQLLIQNITIQYEKFKILHRSGKNYTNEIFSHLFGEKIKQSELLLKQEFQQLELQNIDVEQPITLQTAIADFNDSFIIETGFSLYIILASLYQVKNLDTLERIYEQVDEKKQNKKQYKSFILFRFAETFFELQETAKQANYYIQEFQKAKQISQRIFQKFKLDNSKVQEDLQLKKIGYRALRFYTTRMGSIEVVLPNKQLKQVRFPLVPHCFSISKAIKVKFRLKIDRSSQQRKIESILQNSDNCIIKLKIEYRFQNLCKRFIFLNVIANNQELWKQIIFQVIVAENLMVLLINNGKEDIGINQALFCLTIFQIVLQFLCFSIFLIRKLPYLKIKSKEIVLNRQINRIKQKELKYKYLESLKNDLLEKDLLFDQKDPLLLENNALKQWYFQILDSFVLYKYILLDYEVIYFLIFTTIAGIALFYNFILSLLLMDLFWRFPTLTSIVNSVWRPIIPILLSLTLFFIFQYYDSVAVYYFFSNNNNYTEYCKNLIQCFSFILDTTFKQNAGSTGYAEATNNNSPEYNNPDFRYSMKDFWEFLYNFFVISLLYSIVTGLILDSFGQQREEAEELQQDTKELCLICGIDKGIIEKKSKHKKGFGFHVRNEHSVWNYIFFLSYLQDKKKSEFNGTESQINELLKKESISWFPINRSMSITTQDQIDLLEQNIIQKISKITKQVNDKLKDQT